MGPEQQAERIERVKRFLDREPSVKFAYLFGSVAEQTAGPLSDIDIAVYLDRRYNQFAKRLTLMDALAKVLRSEHFDFVVLNRAPITLKFAVIKTGIVLKEDRQERVDFELRATQEYLATAYLREVQIGYLKEQLRKGRVDG
jgi:predicted nucleotidyltransferase